MTDSNTAPAAPATEAPAAAAAPATPAPAPAATPAAPPAAPADPWASFKPPEGFTVEALKPIVEWAQKAGLDPKAAAAVALRDKQAKEAEEAEMKQLSEKGWLDELTADPKLGGANIRETMVDAMRGHDRLPPEVQQMIKDQGVLYNPIIVRILHAVGKSQREDSFVRPGASPTPKPQMSDDDRLASMFAKKA